MSGYRFDRLRILVVDDNVHMRKLVGTILHAFGIVQIHEEESARGGWAALRDLNPDVIILDWMMDGMTGLELTRMIRTGAASPSPFVPIIMLSGHTQIERVREARDAGVNEFLAKPVSVNGLMTRLLTVIEYPRPFVRTKGYFGPCRRRREQHEYRGPERRSGPDTAMPAEFDAVA